MCETTHEEFIADTATFIANNEAWLKNTINSIGWTLEDLTILTERDQSNFVSCPIIAEHRMPAQSLEEHVLRCEKNHETYPDISKLDLNTNTFLQSSDLVIKGELDHAFHESETAATSAKQVASSQTLAELLQAERDAKRRRAAHRGKRVHSNKKSYNEVMREVIANQMLTLADDVENEIKSDRDSKSEIQESIIQNTPYLGTGESYCRGNPYKRWLTIARQETMMMERMRNRDARYSSDRKQEENRKSRSLKLDHDYRTSRRDYREDRRRNFHTNEVDRDSIQDESWNEQSRNESRMKTEMNLSIKGRRSRDQDSRESTNRDLKSEKQSDSTRHGDSNFKKARESSKYHRPKDSEVKKLEDLGNGHRHSTSERKRKHEDLKILDKQEKKHQKKKKKKHKHKKKSRRSSSSS